MMSNNITKDIYEQTRGLHDINKVRQSVRNVCSKYDYVNTFKVECKERFFLVYINGQPKSEFLYG